MERRKEGESDLGDLVASQEENHRALAAAWWPPFGYAGEVSMGRMIPTEICSKLFVSPILRAASAKGTHVFIPHQRDGGVPAVDVPMSSARTSERVCRC